MTYGDAVTDLDIRRVIDFHLSHGKMATVTAVRPIARFGTIELDGNLVSHFEEKPPEEGGWVNGGFFVLSSGVFDLIDGDDVVWEHVPMQHLAAEGELAAYLHDGFWHCHGYASGQAQSGTVVGQRQSALGNLERGGLMNVWQGRRVFVTGHTGFKGGWLSLWLHEVGACVSGYGLLPESEPNLFAAAGIDRIVDSTIADVRDLSALCESLSRSKAEVVFHLAAQPLVQRGYADPIETYSTNVMGTAHVLEAACQCESVRAVVVVTTDKCYERQGMGLGISGK